MGADSNRFLSAHLCVALVCRGKRSIVNTCCNKIYFLQTDDSDEDPLAISKRWTFEWNSRRWSRLQDMHFLLGSPNESNPEGCQGEGEGLLRSTVSSESVLTDISKPEITDISSLHSQESLGAMLPDSVSMASLVGPYQVRLSSCLPPISHVLNQSNVFIKPSLHQMSQSAVQKPSLKPQTASNVGVEARWLGKTP
ncbi:unnamed protein product [Oncorhynchus mykiss]|uniref:Uncharacterized protein n=1 Tax=Oncorhynchus mykiss TaxID=8022 RepID=A0A060Z5P7_ONCMY|nr:unnamed protein product [Oncorhynchus mykiss]